MKCHSFNTFHKTKLLMAMLKIICWAVIFILINIFPLHIQIYLSSDFYITRNAHVMSQQIWQRQTENTCRLPQFSQVVESNWFPFHGKTYRLWFLDCRTLQKGFQIQKYHNSYLCKKLNKYIFTHRRVEQMWMESLGIPTFVKHDHNISCLA